MWQPPRVIVIGRSIVGVKIEEGRGRREGEISRGFGDGEGQHKNGISEEGRIGRGGGIGILCVGLFTEFGVLRLRKKKRK